MRVPLSWLRDYVDVALPPRDLAELLTLRGMEVQSIETEGAADTQALIARAEQISTVANSLARGLKVTIG